MKNKHFGKLSFLECFVFSVLIRNCKSSVIVKLQVQLSLLAATFAVY